MSLLDQLLDKLTQKEKRMIEIFKAKALEGIIWYNRLVKLNKGVATCRQSIIKLFDTLSLLQ